MLRAREGEHYEVLQLTADATTREAKSAFRRLARLLHPDKSSVPRTADAFFRLQAAHEVLADADRKAEYDRMRDLGAFSGGGGFGGFGGGAVEGRVPRAAFAAAARRRVGRRRRLRPVRERVAAAGEEAVEVVTDIVIRHVHAQAQIHITSRFANRYNRRGLQAAACARTTAATGLNGARRDRSL